MYTRTHQYGFIEEVAKSLCEVPYEAVRVAQDVEAQHQHVGLLDELLAVVGHHQVLEAGHRHRPAPHLEHCHPEHINTRSSSLPGPAPRTLPS